MIDVLYAIQLPLAKLGFVAPTPNGGSKLLEASFVNSGREASIPKINKKIRDFGLKPMSRSELACLYLWQQFNLSKMDEFFLLATDEKDIEINRKKSLLLIPSIWKAEGYIKFGQAAVEVYGEDNIFFIDYELVAMGTREAMTILL
jgi:hypothetical protein